MKEVALTALTFILGLQLLRSLFTELVFYLRDAVGVTTPMLGLYALLLFLIPFASTRIQAVIGTKNALVLVTTGIGLARIAEQVVTTSPFNLALATAGTALFLCFVPMYTRHLSGQGTALGGIFGIGVLLGIAADTALRGALGTLDLSRHDGIWALLLVIILVSLQWTALRSWSRTSNEPSSSNSFGHSLPLLGLGPIIVLDLLLFQNIGQQTVSTGWAQPTVFAWITLSNAAGILVGSVAMGYTKRSLWGAAGVLGILLIAIVLTEGSGQIAGVLDIPAITGASILVGQIAISVSMILIGMALGCPAITSRKNNAGVVTSSSLLLIMILLFLYYSSYDLGPIVPKGLLTPAAASIVLLASLAAIRRPFGPLNRFASPWVPGVMALVLLILPGLYWLSWEEVRTTDGSGFPVRVMSYNLHQGFNTSGQLDIESIAAAIEKENPDVVAIQEVSRGWVVNGSLDMLVWLSQRLGMPYVWGPTADPIQGNAILSRYPILHSETNAMPNNHLLALARAFTAVTVDIGNGKSLLIIGTHLHNIEDEGDQRIPQVTAITDFVKGYGSVLVLGDLNALPADSEIDLLRNAGLVDAFSATNPTAPGYTWPSNNPTKRIDYIWASQDLLLDDFSIHNTKASDHFPIAVTVSQ